MNTLEAVTLDSSAPHVGPWRIVTNDVRSEFVDNRPPEISPEIAPASYFRWKPLASRAFACVLAIPGIPIIGILMVLVRLTSRGPAIYSQLRVGKDNRTFRMFKLRSMRFDAEENSGPVWSQENDPRVTPIGRFLRDHHLDELPQLINVIRGEMDLFGPRPERPEFTTVLTAEIPTYRDRVKVLPGITGLAQINLPPDSDLESVRRKLDLDLEYIERANFWLDAKMFFATFLRLMGVPREWVMHIAKPERIRKLRRRSEHAVRN